MKTPRIALIHATPVAIDPICNTFKRLWPQAQVSNLLDDSLSRDLAAAGRLEQKMINRFCTLARYTEDNGADAILFTCSAFGLAIEAARAAVSIPVLKPNEAMMEEAIANGPHIVLLATFEPSLGDGTTARRTTRKSQWPPMNSTTATPCYSASFPWQVPPRAYRRSAAAASLPARIRR